MVELAVIISN